MTGHIKQKGPGCIIFLHAGIAANKKNPKHTRTCLHFRKCLNIRETGGYLDKPILIDFTGWACVNCRKMEENIWGQPQVAAVINEDFILASLYVDDRKQLQQSIFYKDKGMQTERDKWAAFEAENFGQFSQPLYVLVTPEGKLLNHSVGYTPDAKVNSDWLGCGLAAYRKNSQ